jgi:hypothetical protein
MIGVLEVDNKDEVLDFVTCRSGPLRVCCRLMLLPWKDTGAKAMLVSVAGG